MPTSIDPQPGENEFECARCGARVHHELTRCPNCGVNLYEPDDEENEKYDRQPTIYREGTISKIKDFIRRLLGRPSPVDELFGASLNQAVLFNDLLFKVGGDRATVERLIDFERRRAPQANRTIWLQNAIKRWERDNKISGPS
jgi:hypothetical protein